MNKLNKLFNLINYYNRFAKAILISEDENYFFYKINDGYVSEVRKIDLESMDTNDLMNEAKYIIRTY